MLNVMLLPAIYLGLYLFILGLSFSNFRWEKATRKQLMTCHLALLTIVILDIFWINFIGVWLDRLIVIAFLLTGTAVFAFHRKTLRILHKIYFGFFVFYPLFLVIAFVMDRIFFAIMAGPLLVSLIVPNIVFSNKDYQIREPFGIIAGARLELIKRGIFTERAEGICNDEDIVYLEISSIQIMSKNEDTVMVLVQSKDKTFRAAFVK
jgi:uncharacterized membrane protein